MEEYALEEEAKRDCAEGELFEDISVGPADLVGRWLVPRTVWFQTFADIA
jgi:hypothetical protein